MGRGRGSFGLSSNRGKRGSGARYGYRGAESWPGGRGRGGSNSLPSDSPAPKREDDGTLLEERFEKVTLNDELNEKMGFAQVQEGTRREAWLINLRPILSGHLERQQSTSTSFTQMNDAKRNVVDAYAEVINATAGGGTSMDIDFEGELGEQSGNSRGTVTQDVSSGERSPGMHYRRLRYAVTFNEGQPSCSHIVERVKRADPVIMAFNNETTKAPLKSPDQATDQVMMISYMIDGQGYLITNREIVSEDIDDFKYTPKDSCEGPFVEGTRCWANMVVLEGKRAGYRNVDYSFQRSQRGKSLIYMSAFSSDLFKPSTIQRFFSHIQEVNGIDMYQEAGFAKDSEDEYKSNNSAHMDCFRRVKRGSYLPQGSQGLKAVTTAKLGYNPIELDPELMMSYAMEQLQVLAQYSVSDAVATYYLYMKYMHPFIFSLCNIIPLNPDEVEVYRGHIMPNRHEESHGTMFNRHLLVSETYGHVEALEAGVFRSDIPANFKTVPAAAQQLIDESDAVLQPCMVEESEAKLEDVTNYDEVKAVIQKALGTINSFGASVQANPLRLTQRAFYNVLQQLASVLHVPPSAGASPLFRIHYYHASFGDLLRNPQRSGKYCIDKAAVNYEVVAKSIQCNATPQDSLISQFSWRSPYTKLVYLDLKSSVEGKEISRSTQLLDTDLLAFKALLQEIIFHFISLGRAFVSVFIP
ncbi:hypothetical protein D9756_007253 [Leucocoprinus leucothites]|uniref:DNA polymerase epsilon catalytic subunit n=1 Tax=Leucocoprinus leucothites TaxID=201217 RepID=A0A8H5FZ51_9AGAR|nr:hypothetical protein D9756_007253 [Leucoagaricus leucothites]